MAVWSEVNRASINEIDRFDAEYYKPEYIEISNTLNKINTDKLNSYIDFVQCGPFGSTIKNNTYISDGVIVARPFNVNSCVFEPDNIVYISEEDVNKKNLSLYDDKDIFFARVGDIRVGILSKTNINKKVTISPNIIATRLNNKKIYPEFVVLFFNTMLGHKQIERALKVVAQPTISTELIRKLKLFIPSKQIQEEVSILFNKSLELKQLSQSLYTQAQELLERELGLDKLFFDKPLSYEARLSEVVDSRRANAEYFSPTAKCILGKIQTDKTRNISSLFTVVRGRSPSSYSQAGIPVIKTKSIRVPTFDENRIDDFVTSADNFVEICEDDLLLASMGVGSLGRISYVNSINSRYIVDGTIRILRKKSSIKEKIAIPTMLFYSTKAGQVLIYRGIVGSTGIISLPDDYLHKLPVPYFNDTLCERISELVIKSQNAKIESQQLLEQAKQRVEELIEQAVQ